MYIYIVYVDWTWKKLLIYSYIILNFNQVMFTYYNHWIVDIGLNIFEKL